MNPHIRYELHEIERIISEGEAHTEIKKAQVQVLDEKLKVETERIQKTLVHEVFSFEDERHLERYIQYHQMALIGLLDKLDKLRQNKNVIRSDFFGIIYASLDVILRFIERHFTKYFDQDSKAPEGYLALARKNSHEQMAVLSRTLTESKADTTIIIVLIHVLQNIVDSRTEKEVTFRKVMYAKEMNKELEKVLENKNSSDINEELRQVMYYLNYNSVKVVTYHAHYISALLESAESREEKIEKLSFILKKVSQAQVKPGIRYNQHSPSLKNQLSEYISVEMEYQERLQGLSFPSSQRPDSPLFGFKLKFETSVGQLAYLIKIFMDTKLIANSNITQVLHFLVAFVITKKSESISIISLRTKYYNVETGTKASVRGMLSTMIHYIDNS